MDMEASVDAAERPCILVVESDPVATVLLTKVVERLGRRAEVVTSGLAAVELVETMDIEAVIADMMLPRMGGRELCEFIRGDEEHKNMQIFVVTAVSDPEELRWMDQLGDIQVVDKPIQVQRLLELLRLYLPTRDGD